MDSPTSLVEWGVRIYLTSIKFYLLVALPSHLVFVHISVSYLPCPVAHRSVGSSALIFLHLFCSLDFCVELQHWNKKGQQTVVAAVILFNIINIWSLVFRWPKITGMTYSYMWKENQVRPYFTEYGQLL